MTTAPTRTAHARIAAPVVRDAALRAVMAPVLNQWPTAGLAVAAVRDGQPTWFREYGVVNTATRAPVNRDTVFRIGSLTKTVTAVAIMQLWEEGRIDLDTPANAYLTAFQLTRARRDLQPATIRHLLTHTSGVGYWRRLSDLLRPGSGAGVQADRIRPLSQYYRGGLPQEVEPGTKWVYSNHGFAALGQIVEDVSGCPLGTYYREHIFDPLGMEHTDLGCSERLGPDVATGYVLRARGLVPVVAREVPTPGSGGLYSTASDLARFVAYLLHPQQGGILDPSTVETMFAPHFLPDPRVPGMGLGFDLAREGEVRTVAKTGVVAGFLAMMALAPTERTGVVVLANTGALSGQGAATPLGGALLRTLLGLPVSALRRDVMPHPETWSELCGWYGPAPGRVTNLFTRALLGAGVEVVVEHGSLALKPITPVPALRRGMRLHQDDPDDPYSFRVDLSHLGMGTLPVVFTGTREGHEPRFVMDLMDFHKRPDVRNPRRVVVRAAAAGAAAIALGRGRHSCLAGGEGAR